jgi:antitoxin HigA-1
MEHTMSSSPTTTSRRSIPRDPRRLGAAVHPGEILLEEFLRPLGLSQAALARHLGISVVRVNELIRGKRGVSAETAWLLGEAFGTSPQFWINLQANYDLASYQPHRHVSKIKMRRVS